MKYEINNKHDVDDDRMISCVSLCPQSTWKTASSNQESSVLQNWCECPEVSTNTNTAACAFPLHPHRCLSVIPSPIIGAIRRRLRSTLGGALPGITWGHQSPCACKNVEGASFPALTGAAESIWVSWSLRSHEKRCDQVVWVETVVRRLWLRPQTGALAVKHLTRWFVRLNVHFLSPAFPQIPPPTLSLYLLKSTVQLQCGKSSLASHFSKPSLRACAHLYRHVWRLQKAVDSCSSRRPLASLSRGHPEAPFTCAASEPRL